MSEPQGLADHVLSIDIQAPVERVWEEITRTGRVQRALFNTVLETELRPGSRLRYYSPNRQRVFIVGEVVEVSPPYRFAHTYMFVQRPEEPTLVTWELHEIPGGTRIVLTHGGFTDQLKTHHSVVKGWTSILELLKQQIETGDIPLRTKFTYRLMGAFTFMLPKATRTEEVERAGW